MKPPRVPDWERAGALRTVARLLRSGIDPNRALRIAAGEARPVVSERLERVRAMVGAGRPLPGAMQARGLLEGAERGRLAAALEAGRPEEALEAIADGLQTKHRFRRQVGQRLIPAGAILVVALVTGPIPAVAAGELVIGDYLARLSAQLVVCGLAILAVFRWGDWVLSRTRDLWMRLRRCPTLAQREALLAQLASLLDAGLSAERSLDCLASDTVGALTRRLTEARSAVAQRGVVEALAGAGAIDPAQDRPPLLAAEEAGRLAAGLAHQARLLSEAVARRRELLAEWLPRAAYLVVIAWIVSGVLGGGLALAI